MKSMSGSLRAMSSQSLFALDRADAGEQETEHQGDQRDADHLGPEPPEDGSHA
jgi:hypothetical protein